MKRFIDNSVKYSFLTIPSLFRNDRLDHATPTEQNTDTSVIKQETGWDRVKRIFLVDEFDNLSVEAQSILQVGALSMFIGGIYGGVIQSRVAYMEFMQNNQATSFKDHLEAKKQLQDKVTLGFGKGAFKWGSRLGLFTTSFYVEVLLWVFLAYLEFHGRNKIWQYNLQHSHNEYFRKGVADYIEKEEYAVIKLHNDEVGEAGKDISNLDKNVNKND
ncbi:hypothetical protein NQ318_019033, partial [Aromia moschata]